MDPALLQQLAIGAIPPGIFGAIVFFAVWWRKQPEVGGAEGPLDFAIGRDVVVVLAIAAAMLVMHPLITAGIKLPEWVVPPRRGADWLPVVTVVAMLIALAGLLLRGQRLPMWAWAIVAIVVVVGLGALAAQRLVRETWSVQESLAHLGGVAVITFVLGWGLLVLARKPGVVGVASVVIVAGSLANILAGPMNSLKLAQLAGVMAAVLTPAAVMTLIRPTQVLAMSAVAMVVMGLGSVSLQGVVFGSAKVSSVVLSLGLLAISPWMGVLAGRVVKRDGVVKSLVQLAAVGLPGAIAMGVWLVQQKAESGAEY
jgi:hypothetical protein